jgi:hypothetical protein
MILSSKQKQPQDVQNITPTLLPTTIQEQPTIPFEKVDEMKDWKVYRGSGYEVKYPSNWDYQETESTYVRFQKGEFKKGLPTSETYISIAKKPDPKNSDLKDWLTEEKILPANDGSQINATDISVDKTIGKQLISLRDGGKTIYVVYGASVYQISNVLMGENIEEAKKVFDQILSTFKFLGENSSINPTITITTKTWNKYINPEEEFTIDYPSDWSIDNYVIINGKKDYSKTSIYFKDKEPYDAISLQYTKYNPYGDNIFNPADGFKRNARETLYDAIDRYTKKQTNPDAYTVTDVSRNGKIAVLMECKHVTYQGAGYLCDLSGKGYLRHLYIEAAPSEYFLLILQGSELYSKVDLAEWIDRVNLK